jgi:hypothetical protein
MASSAAAEGGGGGKKRSYNRWTQSQDALLLEGWQEYTLRIDGKDITKREGARIWEDSMRGFCMSLNVEGMKRTAAQMRARLQRLGHLPKGGV